MCIVCCLCCDLCVKIVSIDLHFFFFIGIEYALRGKVHYAPQ
jgi:hypothetical protein